MRLGQQGLVALLENRCSHLAPPRGSQSCPGLECHPDWPSYLHVHLEASFRLEVFVRRCSAFLRTSCSFPRFLKARCLIPAPAPTRPIFPGGAVFHRVCSLCPDVSSEVMIMGLENVVAVMTALSKSYKWGGYRGSMNEAAGSFLQGSPKWEKMCPLLPELAFQRRGEAGRPTCVLAEHT